MHPRLKTIQEIDGNNGAAWLGVKECGEYKCIIKHPSDSPVDADLLLFNPWTVQRRQFPPQKTSDAIWGFYAKEANTQLDSAMHLKNWDGFFNYSAAYSRLDDEGSFYIFRDKAIKLSPPGAKYFRSKPNMSPPRALWFVSHCSGNIGSAREEYALELSKYIPVDAYTSSKKDKCGKRLGSLVKYGGEPKMDDYMFYLAFENNLCKHYITQKVWKILEINSTTIPIALGGTSIEEYELVFPPNSFIHVKNFTSPEALAKHLKFVSENDHAFHYYHQWRNEYQLTSSHGRKHRDYLCYMCKQINERPQQVWNTFSEHYFEGRCLNVTTPESQCQYYNFGCNH